MDRCTDELDRSVETEVGYLLGREHWGNGYATEAAIARSGTGRSQSSGSTG